MEKLALDIYEAAQALSLSPWTLRKWISTGRLRATRLGRRVCVTPEALQELVKSGAATRKKKRSA